MTTTSNEPMALLYAALSKAQGEIEDAAIDRVNPHLKNKYATLASVLASVRPVLAKHGLCVSQWPVNGPDDRTVGITTIVGHAGGGVLTNIFYLPLGEAKGLSDAQRAGVVITYGRRYAIMAALGVSAVEDDEDGSRAPAPGLPARREEPRREAPPAEEAPGKAGHHPSWLADRARFCAALRDLGLAYDDVAAACERRGKLRPSAASTEARQDLYRHLRGLSPEARAEWIGGSHAASK